MSINYLRGITLLVERLTASITTATTIAPMENISYGGNLEASLLPALLVGDAGSTIIKPKTGGNHRVKEGHFFIMVATENTPEGFNQANGLINAVITAALYQQGNNAYPRWQPDGFLKPFELADSQPPAAYYGTFTTRSVIFSIPYTLN